MELDKVFFTADPHYFHKAIIDFEKRAFIDAESMNEALIWNYNITVPKDGHTFILGDFSFGKAKETVEVLKRLNGTKYLILGNHDEKRINQEIKDQFVWVMHYYKLRLQGYRFILSHYPFLDWDGKNKGYIHLHGHCHKYSHEDVQIKNKINVGVDVCGYAPIAATDIVAVKENI